MIGDPLTMIRNTADGLVASTVTLDQEGCRRLLAHIAAQEAVVEAAQRLSAAQNKERVLRRADGPETYQAMLSLRAALASPAAREGETP